MAETNVQALEKIFTEVDESQIKIIFSSQCIKAQAFLVEKLKKQTKHQKEVCSFISSGNIKLEAEIKLAEQEIKNLLIAHDTIKLGNIELRKEWLLKKSEKLEIIERINSGEKKYEHLWLESKNRFESIPYVQKYLQAKNRSEIIQNNINNLLNEYLNLMRQIKINKDALMDQDQKMIINLVTFLMKEQPKIIQTLHDKVREIKELNAEIAIFEEKDPNSKTHSKISNRIEIEQSQQIEKISQTINKVENAWPCLSKNENEGLLMPMLRLQSMDLDILSVKLDQIRKVDLYAEQQKEATIIDRTNNCTESKINDEYSSIYFNNMGATFDEDSKTKNYSERKLIHIIKDVKLKKNETLHIISKVDPSRLCNVNAIRSEISEVKESEDKVSQALSVDQDTHSGKKTTDLLVPPSQFLDESKSSQEKKVSFDISMEISNCKLSQQDSITDDGKSNETLHSQNVNFVSEEGNEKLTAKMPSEDNLDSSQQFIYNEHSILHKMTQDKTITSKFFDPKTNDINKFSDLKENNCDVNTSGTGTESKKPTQLNTNIVNDGSDVKMNEIILSKTNQYDAKVNLPITGFLFNHGSQGVPDSLNLSESTMGFEEGDGDFPHCIDSNILLSPKADITIEATDEDVKVSSQELPSFMTGVRKSGLSFFGWSSGDTKPKSNNGQSADSNFNFNFVGEEKKGRGGLFNMFH